MPKKLKPADLRKLAERGLRIKKRIEQDQVELKEICETILPAMRDRANGSMSSAFTSSAGLVEYRKSTTMSILQENVAKIRDILQTRFDIFFQEKHEVKPRVKQLKGMLLEQNSDDANAIRGFITMDEREAVSFKPAA